MPRNSRDDLAFGAGREFLGFVCYDLMMKITMDMVLSITYKNVSDVRYNINNDH